MHFYTHLLCILNILIIYCSWSWHAFVGGWKDRRKPGHLELYVCVCFFFWQLTRRLHFIFEPRWMRYQPRILCDFARNKSTKNVFYPTLKYPMRCWKHVDLSNILRGALAPFWELDHVHQASHVKGMGLRQWCDGNLNRQGPVPSLWSIVTGCLRLKPVSSLAFFLQARSWKWLRVAFIWEYLGTLRYSIELPHLQ